VASAEFRYRPPSANPVGIVAVTLVGGDIVLWMLLPGNRDIGLSLPILLTLGWFSWIVWAYPSIRVSDTVITIFNTWWTQRIPLSTVRAVTGGKRLTITTIDGRKHIPAAVPGPPPFLPDAIRRVQAYGGYAVPVSDVDRLRMDDRARTAATVVADLIRRRVEDSPARLGVEREPVPAPVANLFVVYGTIVVVAVSVGLFALLQL
jgi:hypothetical protein